MEITVVIGFVIVFVVFHAMPVRDFTDDCMDSRMGSEPWYSDPRKQRKAWLIWLLMLAIGLLLMFVGCFNMGRGG